MKQIQAKLNKGGTIYFLKGNYIITKQLVIPEGTELNLGEATLKRCGNIQSIFINKCNSTTTKYKGAGKIKITGGTFEGMASYSIDNLLTFFHSHDIDLEYVTFQDTLCHSVELNSCKNVRIYSCNFLGSNTKEDYKEMIQIDQAGVHSFVLNGTKPTDKCYDNTCCQNVVIEGCMFSKSEYRDLPKTCIGNHTQIYGGGSMHKNIQILCNTFLCKGKEATLSLIGMKNVLIEGNIFSGGGRLCRIYSKDCSYDAQGNKKEPKKNDGQCNKIKIRDNTYVSVSSSVPIYIFGCKHKNLEIIGNSIVTESKREVLASGETKLKCGDHSYLS